MNDLEQGAYARQLVGDALATAEAERTTSPEAFTRRVLEELEQAGVVSNTYTAYHRSHGLEVHGYGTGETPGGLDLFVTEFRQSPLEDRLTKAQAESRFKRLLAFLRRCQNGLRQHIDESSDVYDMCDAVEKALTEAPQIRLFLLSNCVSTSAAPPPVDFDGIPVIHEIWDLPRLHRQETSGTLSEPIAVTFDPPLPCLSPPSTEADHSVALTVLPGDTLADLYTKHGTRLLELNVRSFLQTRGSVNRGIRESLLDSPGRFLAYNNGITATASQVEFVEGTDGQHLGISKIHGLQIVNGGQTTASLHHAKKRDRADLSHVRVQMKLTVVPPERLMEIVPKISEYSNTQNKVTLVDFSSNHEFHVDVQRITRSLWAPAADGSGQETHWFYERARGQYADELAQLTAAGQKRFRTLWLTRQKFTKADLAKYALSWDQLPHLVSRGAQKNFAEFMIRLREHPVRVDTLYCQRVIAKAILFKTADQVARAHGAGSYKSAVTTYMVARLSLAVGKRLDLGEIWRRQQVSDALAAALDDLCPRVMASVTHPLRGSHIGEWAKQSACWEAVSRVQWSLDAELEAELLDAPVEDTLLNEDEGADVDGTTAMEDVEGVSEAEWAAIEEWSKVTRSLLPSQRQLVQVVGWRLRAGEPISETQAMRVLHVRSEAMRLGFTMRE
ncbi:AIPR family protein [Streptomyces sp. TBY4]|uniref:AIPR family protein n=1 Tax=Streptomyces sp. TBY4 TaxID=2962030 RepID=UPI0020B84088|nr:AIPR family protein [Streptomyces sp. TBY4]MCP3758382.1 AIPR family protein [Streptomyces sp. TBY4]